MNGKTMTDKATEPAQAVPAVGAQVDRGVRPRAWVRPNAGWVTGVASYGEHCPPGWVGAAEPLYEQAAIDAANSERHDLALLVARLIRRMRAARTGEGMAAGDDALERQAVGYLMRKGLMRPLRADCGEAGHDEGKCGNAACLGA